MRKLLIGIIAAGIIVGTGAYFGAKLWTQLQAKSEVEAAFESLRGTFQTVSHSKIEFDAAGRTLKIPDLVLGSGDQVTRIKFEQIAAYGTATPTTNRIAADRIEITNAELTTALPAASGLQITYKAPKIVIEAYSGPAALLTRPSTASMIEVMGSWLEYIAASTASTITIPKLSAIITSPASTDSTASLGPIEYTYTDIVFREIRDRRIGEMAVERITITSETTSPELGSFAAAMARFSLVDFHLDGVIAMLDPAKAKDDRYIPVYRQVSVGPLEFRFAKGLAMQLEGLSLEDIAVRPSKLSYANFLSMAEAAPKPGTPPSPAQTRALMEHLANVYEGLRFGKMEMRGFRTDVPPGGPVKFAAIRLSGFDNGRLGEFAIEGLDVVTPQKDPVHIGRFALKGLNLADLMRRSAELSETGRVPSLEQSLGLFALLEGIELSDVTANSALTQQPVRIESFQFSWGQFVGSIPTTLRLIARTTIPTNLADPATGGLFADAGLSTMTTTIDFGLTWSETTETLNLSPAVIELEKAFAFAANFSIRKVQRSMFSLDANQAMAAANLAEIGPLEITLRDTGAVTTALAHYAKGKGLSPEDARKEVIESVMETAKSSSQSNPDAMTVAQAIVQFIETPGSTLTIKATPKDRVSVNQVFGAATTDPTAASSLFAIEAKTAQ